MIGPGSLDFWSDFYVPAKELCLTLWQGLAPLAQRELWKTQWWYWNGLLLRWCDKLFPLYLLRNYCICYCRHSSYVRGRTESLKGLACSTTLPNFRNVRNIPALRVVFGNVKTVRIIAGTFEQCSSGWL